MKESIINQLFTPKLESPILMEGLPGFGDVGRLAAQQIIKYTEAKLFAEYYSPLFPDYVSVSKEGVCSPPRYRFYAPPSGEKLNAIVLTGHSQPSPENIVAHYRICKEVLEFAEKLGCRFLVTVGGVPVSTDRKDVYVAATSAKLAASVMEKGAIIYGKGRIMGATGLLLGMAKQRGLKGICLLGATGGIQPDKDAGSAVFQLILKLFSGQSKLGM